MPSITQKVLLHPEPTSLAGIHGLLRSACGPVQILDPERLPAREHGFHPGRHRFARWSISPVVELLGVVGRL